MRIFVTGGTGFLGSHFLAQATNAGHELVALRRHGTQCGQPLIREPLWIDGTLEDYPKEALHRIDVLVHLAACGVNPNHANWQDCFRWNVTAPLALWLEAAASGVRRFVIAGSCFEYGSSGESFDFIPTSAALVPTGPYHSSKAAATMAALGFAVDLQRELIVLRPFHIYGEGEPQQRFWPSLKEAALRGQDFSMSDGQQIRDFIRVQDVATSFVNAVERQDIKSGRPIIENVGSGIPRTLLQFAEDEWKRLGATGRLLPGGIPVRQNEVMRYIPELP